MDETDQDEAATVLYPQEIGCALCTKLVDGRFRVVAGLQFNDGPDESPIHDGALAINAKNIRATVGVHTRDGLRVAIP